ncbi:MAG: RNA methyltransferase [Fibrobacteria bacterium]|nr:RNA methyltransferase [Fibrobacteria bacterium]
MQNLNRIVLVEPELPENIGFVARAMSCFGWSDLAVVGPALDPTSAAWRTATLGKEILDAATSHETLLSAFGPARTTIAFTRRPHQKGLVDLPDLARRLPDLESPVALVFGRESIGLTSDEVLACDLACQIPTHHPTGSLNLGQAVAIALSHLHDRPAPPPSGSVSRGAALASLREEWVRGTLERTDLLGILHPARREAGRRHLASLFRRLRPSREELRFLTALLIRLTRNPPKSEGN